MTRQTAFNWTRGAIGAAILWLAGCGTPPGQFVIIQNQLPESGCAVSAGLTGVYRGSGDLDVGLVDGQAPDGYVLFPVMQNNLAAPSGGQTTDPNRITLSGYAVDVNVPADAPADEITNLFTTLRTPDAATGSVNSLVHFLVPTSGSVASGGGNTSAIIAVVPGGLARAIRDTHVLEQKRFVWIDAMVRARGTTLVKSVESDVFHYPIRVCDGCLINDLGACPLKDAPPRTGNACNLAQDQTVDCCNKGPRSFVCPASVSAK